MAHQFPFDDHDISQRISEFLIFRSTLQDGVSVSAKDFVQWYEDQMLFYGTVVMIDKREGRGVIRQGFQAPHVGITMFNSSKGPRKVDEKEIGAPWNQ